MWALDRGPGPLPMGFHCPVQLEINPYIHCSIHIGGLMEKLKNLAEFELVGTRYPILPLFLKILYLILIVAGVGLTIIFAFGFIIGGEVLIDYAYYWLFISIFMPCTFLIIPGRKKDATRVPWYDYIAMVVIGGASFYNFFHAYDIALQDWYNVTTGIIVFLGVLEGARR